MHARPAEKRFSEGAPESRGGAARAVAPPVAVPRNRGMHRFALLVAGATFVLLVAGASVTSTGSGLAVPDWPLSFGTLFPPMVGGVLYEHGHRMIAGFVLVLMTILTIWLFLREERVWVRRMGLAGLLILVAQAVLGGLTVLFRLPAPISVGHASLAVAFFGLAVGLALFTSSSWRETRKVAMSGASSLRRLAILTTGAVYVQILIGAVMRHTGAGLAIPDFPLAYGRLVPPVFSPPILVHYAHRVGALVVLLCVIFLVHRVVRKHRDQEEFLGPALLLAGMIVVQLLLGAFTVWTRLAVLPTTAHVAFGAAIFAVCLVLTLRAFRRLPAALEKEDPTADPREFAEIGDRNRIADPPGVFPLANLRWNFQGWTGVLLMRNGTVLGGVSAESADRKFTEIISTARLGALRDYVGLAKPRIVVMVLLTALAGFYLGAQGSFDIRLLLHTLIGTGLVVGSANTLNQLLERDLDSLMRRTRNRPLPAGRMDPREALLSGMGLVIVGQLYLAVGVNPLAALLALLAWANYVFLYTPLKTRTSLSTVVGAVSGALPPVIGWVAVRGGLGIESLALFSILFLWQLPHFLAIAWMYREDYARAGFPMTPVVDPEGSRTGREIVIYCAALVPTGLVPALLGLAGGLYFYGALAAGIVFLGFGIRTAFRKTGLSAKQLFLVSLLYLPVLVALMMLDGGRL